MKYTRILILLSASFIVCGFTSPFFVSEDDAAEKLYGKTNMKNLVVGKTEILNKENNFSCSGMYVIVQPNAATKEEKKLQTGMPFARVKCSDGRLIELKWNKEPTVDGVDQYKKTYKFKQVKNKDFKKYIKDAYKPQKEKKVKAEKV